MDIICLKTNRHFGEIESLKQCEKEHNSCDDCPFMESDITVEIHSESIIEDKNEVQIQRVDVYLPPPFNMPKHPNQNKPFLGAYSKNEVKLDVERYCSNCHTKGLYAHCIPKWRFVVIDSFWCPKCKVVLWENQTYK